ncbi:MAG TPA: hypothetical protein VJZ51_05100 [Bacilli bacterium]|nr:hypothetical protein [Bacilli bacterium]
MQIVEVIKKKDIKKFIDFPNKLYMDNPYYVPCIFMDEMNNLNPKKNPAYQYAETKLFLAYDGKKIVGRICGLINHAYNQKKNVKQIRFTRFDVIDDIEITKALINAVMDWGRSREIFQLIGPIGFSDLDKQGMLVDGFTEMSNSLTLYNHEYYVKHLEQIGFKKDADWVEYQVFTPQEMNERISKLAKIIQKRYEYKIVKAKNGREAKPYAYEVFNLVNESFAHLYGVVKLTDKQIRGTVKQFITLINFEYCYIITDKNDLMIGFGALTPSINEALRKSRGRLFPFGALRILKATKKGEVLDMYILAVKPEYQNLGVNALILCEGIKSAIKNGIKYAETGPELETNHSVRDQWKEFDVRQHRRRRSWIIDFK